MSEINELRNKLLELQTKNADVRAAIDEFQAKLDKLKQELQPKPRSREAMLWPHVGDEYWVVDEFGDEREAEWDDDEFDHYRLSSGNCHRTEAEALAYRDWQTDPRVVARGIIERMEGADPDGLYSIVLAGDQIRVSHHTFHKFGSFEFKELGHAQAVVDKHPDLCKVALGVITDKEEAERIVRLAIGNASDSGEAIWCG